MTLLEFYNAPQFQGKSGLYLLYYKNEGKKYYKYRFT